MHPIFHVQTDHMRALDDGQARELLARLCRLHIQRVGLDPANVFWGGDQRAADEGVDVRVDGQPVCDVGGPLGRSVAIIQVKAELFGPAKIVAEMAPKGVIRPSIAALAPDTGAYVIASTRDDPADPKRRNRVAAMETVLNDHGLTGKIRVDFLGARQIADWVEQFPPLAIWVRERIGKPIQGWNGYGPWAYKETDQSAEFIVGKEPRVFAPGAVEAMTDLQALNAIRRDLAAGTTVRLVGLSGVGKTRLAQVLFDPRIQTNAASLSQDWAIYTDISNSPDPSPEVMIETLAGFGERSILIVDNCGQKSHRALVERKAKVANKLGLLTIEYDIQDDLPDDTTVYRLEGVSDETLSALLRSRYPQLSWSDAHVVIAASEGNSRLAFALASTSKQSDDLSSLKDGDLFRRLFEQSRGAGDELLRCAKAASLIYSFDGEDLSATSEIAILASFASSTPIDFRRNMVELRRRGLLQERGKWRALLPHAVSNRLAAEALEEHPASDLENRLCATASERVRSSFAHRLSFLHASSAAKKLVCLWLEPGGFFSDLAGLSTKDFLIFLRLSVVTPEQALAATERFAAEGGAGQRHESEVDKLAQLVQSIAYDPDLFDRCVKVLLDLLPLQSIDRRTGEQTLDQLKPLFQLYYSGTMAPGAQRAKFVERLLTSDQPSERRIGLVLLEETLRVRGFRNQSTFQFGARKRSSGWWPKSIEEQREWYLLFINIAEPYATRADDTGRRIRAALGRGVFGFAGDSLLTDRMAALAPRLVACDGWLDAWKAVNELLRRKNVDGELRTNATTFKALVAPTGLRAQVRAMISMRDPIDHEDNDEDIADAADRAAARGESLGQALAVDPALLRELLPALIDGSARYYVLSVGRGVAQATPDAPRLFAQIRALIEAAPDPEQLNPSFVCGLISAWGEQDAVMTASLLDSAIDNPAIGPWFPNLQISVPMDEQGAERIRRALDANLAPLWRYRSLGYGGALRPVSVESITTILDSLTTKGQEGIHVAIDVLHMVIYSAKERRESEQQLLSRYCRDFLTLIDWPELDDHAQERLDYEIEELISCAVKHSVAFEDIQGVLSRAVQARTIHPRYLPSTTGNFLAPIIRRHPKEALTYLFGLEDPKRRHAVSDLILEESTVDPTGKGVPTISDDLLIQWCAEDSVPRISFAARICRLADPTDQQPLVAHRLYELALDKCAFIEEIAERGERSGSSEREVPILHRIQDILSSLPIEQGSPEEASREQAMAQISRRIDWWTEILGRTSRERDESFE
ncbi:hypothetical protein IMW82_15070 [Rhodanobacter sp. B2A1Ga4]|uniref:hypothetical protein n=1 Tax=Rhodanobacter sp. B2A1Ga4 TaxID=2778647 RepID=UPI001B395B9B|nr:hypothetical protein [Rhodanobacter sp. B2A1Ga4]MBQ4855989.1 hypothetical protein [Rhodanobacter sp. B2A1Ga4]